VGTVVTETWGLTLEVILVEIFFIGACSTLPLVDDDMLGKARTRRSESDPTHIDKRIMLILLND
jgi:hypothetical protein